MPTVDELAHGPLKKIDRAIHHINDLKREIEAYLTQRPFVLMVHYKRSIGRIEWRTKTQKSIPEDFALIIGDAVHNLVAALDIALYSMARHRAPSPHEIAFPFPRNSTPEALEGAINNRQVKFAGTKVAEAVKRLKPYPGGHPILSTLHAVDVRDKHHLLLLTRDVASMTGHDLGKLDPKIAVAKIIGDGRIHLTAYDNDLLFGRPEIFVTRGMPDSEKEAEIQPAFHIAFKSGEPANGAVLPFLQSSVDAVKEAVSSLIEAYLDPGNVFP